MQEGPVLDALKDWKRVHRKSIFKRRYRKL